MPAAAPTPGAHWPPPGGPPPGPPAGAALTSLTLPHRANEHEGVGRAAGIRFAAFGAARSASDLIATAELGLLLFAVKEDLLESTARSLRSLGLLTLRLLRAAALILLLPALPLLRLLLPLTSLAGLARTALAVLAAVLTLIPATSLTAAVATATSARTIAGRAGARIGSVGSGRIRRIRRISSGRRSLALDGLERSNLKRQIERRNTGVGEIKFLRDVVETELGDFDAIVAWRKARKIEPAIFAGPTDVGASGGGVDHAQGRARDRNAVIGVNEASDRGGDLGLLGAQPNSKKHDSQSHENRNGSSPKETPKRGPK